MPPVLFGIFWWAVVFGLVSLMLNDSRRPPDPPKTTD